MMAVEAMAVEATAGRRCSSVMRSHEWVGDFLLTVDPAARSTAEGGCRTRALHLSLSHTTPRNIRSVSLTHSAHDLPF